MKSKAIKILIGTLSALFIVPQLALATAVPGGVVHPTPVTRHVARSSSKKAPHGTAIGVRIADGNIGFYTPYQVNRTVALPVNTVTNIGNVSETITFHNTAYLYVKPDTVTLAPNQSKTFITQLHTGLNVGNQHQKMYIEASSASSSNSVQITEKIAYVVKNTAFYILWWNHFLSYIVPMGGEIAIGASVGLVAYAIPKVISDTRKKKKSKSHKSETIPSSLGM